MVLSESPESLYELSGKGWSSRERGLQGAGAITEMGKPPPAVLGRALLLWPPCTDQGRQRSPRRRAKGAVPSLPCGPGFGREQRWRCECGAEPAATRSPPAQRHLPLISSNYCPFPFIMINTCRLRWIKYWLPLNIFTNTHTHIYIYVACPCRDFPPLPSTSQPLQPGMGPGHEQCPGDSTRLSCGWGERRDEGLGSEPTELTVIYIHWPLISC